LSPGSPPPVFLVESADSLEFINEEADRHASTNRHMGMAAKREPFAKTGTVVSSAWMRSAAKA
jgi:hypothetical protein